MIRSQFLSAVLFTAVFTVGTHAAAADRMVGLVPSDGTNMLVKAFTVAAGTMILGAQFENNDPSTTFPMVLLVRGPASTISEGTVVASATNVQETAPGLVTITWTTAVQATADPYYLAICPPAGSGREGPGVGPGVGADNVLAANGSFLAYGVEGAMSPLRSDLRISLMTGATKASGTAPNEQDVIGRPFLSSRIRAGGLTLSFGLAKEGMAVLRIYDVAGHAVRELVREELQAGSHECTWDGKNEGGSDVAKGVYFAQLLVSAQTLEHKIVKVW